MPVLLGRDSNGCFARWGKTGHKYHYKCNSADARRKAKRKAHVQGAAIKAKEGK